jgi:hypothetical protein
MSDSNHQSSKPFLSMPTRKRTRAQRSESKARRVLPHQIQLDKDGNLPVHEFILTEHFDDDVLYPTQVYMAPLEPITEGFNRHSQTAIVMQALELHGAESARL